VAEKKKNEPHLPSEVSNRIGFFDKFAGHAALFASRAPFFAFCVLLILVWAPTFLILPFDTWQLIINTATTIVTFLMVALLQNSQSRNDQALQHKLNAIADALSDLMEAMSDQVPEGTRNLADDMKELKLAVGLEDRESTTGNSSDDDGDTDAGGETGDNGKVEGAGTHSQSRTGDRTPSRQ
jgi:low affinity Fe/Cu permease